MTSLAELRFTDGTRSLDLLQANTSGRGVALMRYTPGRVNLKGGGIWQDSPAAHGRRLVDAKRGNAIDTFEFAIAAASQDEAASYQSDLDFWIEKAIAYWTSRWQDEVVYLVSRATNEEFYRYAVVYYASIPNYSDYYGQEFNGVRSTIVDLTMTLERSAWMSEPPGTGVVVNLSNDLYATPNDDGVQVAARWTDNIDYLYRADSGSSSFTDLFAISPQYVLADDTEPVIYFGCTTHPFGGVVFDIATPLIFGSTTTTWEYSENGSPGVWTEFDDLSDGTADFFYGGVRSVQWEQASGWGKTTVNGVNAYWARVTISHSGTWSIVQQNRDVYTPCRPYVDIASTEIDGDIEALALIRSLIERSDLTSPLSHLLIDNILVGLRSYDRGSDFRSFLNIRATDCPSGVSTTLSSGVHINDPTFETNGFYSTGEAVLYTGNASDTTPEAIITWTFDSTIAEHFRGTFRVFLRASSETTVFLRYRFASTLVVYGGDVVGNIVSNNDTDNGLGTMELFDLGLLQIPPSSVIAQSEAIGTFDLSVEGYISSAFDLRIDCLILLPADEWGGEISNNGAFSESTTDRSIDIDSILYPKEEIRGLLRESDLTTISAVYRVNANGPAILNPNTRQRFWFCLGSSDGIARSSDPECTAIVTAYKSQRYFNLRSV